MIIGIPKEIKDQEYRVAMTPGGVLALVEAGHRVIVQADAGTGSGFSDADYAQAGAEIAAKAEGVWEAGLVVKVKEPQPAEFDFLRPDLILFTFLHLAAEERLTREMTKRGLTAIGYETVELDDGSLPLLKPMSEIAGRISIQIGAHYLEKKNGGKGKLLGGVPGVPPARVAIIGGGIVGGNAAKIALGMGADVTVINNGVDRLRYLEEVLPGRLTTVSADPVRIAEATAESDLLVGAVLLKGARTPRVVTRKMIAAMQPGSVAVDVSVDQGGCLETTRPTTHSAPTYTVDGVIHYAVTNMPAAVPYTGTRALSNVTLPYVAALAERGIAAIREDPALARGVNTFRGQVTYRAVAEAFGIRHVPLQNIL